MHATGANFIDHCALWFCRSSVCDGRRLLQQRQHQQQLLQRQANHSQTHLATRFARRNMLSSLCVRANLTVVPERERGSDAGEEHTSFSPDNQVCKAHSPYVLVFCLNFIV